MGYDFRQMHLLNKFWILALLLIGFAGGCAASHRAMPPPDWPATWAGRKLFYTQRMLVYARDGSVADQSAQMVTDLGSEFTRRTGSPPTAGLLIVTDVEDSDIGKLQLDDGLSGSKQDPEILEMGIPKTETVLATPFPIEKDQLGIQGGFSDRAMSSVEWAAAIPSDRRVEQFGNRMIDVSIKKQDLNFAQRLLIIPFMPMVHGVFNEAMHAKRDVVIYQRFCAAQRGWDESRREREAEDYQAQRMKSLTNSIAATTQQAVPAAPRK